LAGETKPYRFLLRMPAELGQRLRDAAERADRSLNREIVERLEASLLEDQRANCTRNFDGGRGMTRRRRQALVAGALALLAVSVLAGAVTLSGKRPAAPSATAGGAFPASFGQHLANLRAAPQSKNFGGPASWEEEQDLARSHPAESVARGWIAAARADWTSTKGRPFPSGKGQKKTWTNVGPSTALYPISPFRTRDLYVAGKYEAGGRMTDVAIAPSCKPGNCRLYVAAAGGGVWRTDNALAGTPKWEFISGSFALNAIGSITLDPNDPTGNTVWVGTGEATASGASVAGVGIYKSTDGGNTWTQLGASTFDSRAVGSIAIHPTNPNVVYAASTRAVRGLSSTTTGAVSVIPGAPQYGLFKSTDGGATWTFIHKGSANAADCNVLTDHLNATSCSPRGVRGVAIDPNDPNVVYAGSYARGVWRSPDAGATWTQIFAPIAPGPATGFTERPEFALADLGATTRMYMQIGETGLLDSTFHVAENAATVALGGFIQKSSPAITNPGWGVNGLCSNPSAGLGQCWYDQLVYSPPGHPNIVYVGGVYVYGEQIANHRAVVMSDDGGTTWYDMTEDVTDDVHPNQLHPDQHALVTHPNNPHLFFEVGDGGLVRSSGQLTNRSGVCATRGFTNDPPPGTQTAAQKLARCQQMLSKVPTKLESMNKGLTTLQFFSLSASPFNSNIIQGGTQDNGTWETGGNANTWLNTNISDGGLNGFDAAIPEFRFSMFFLPQVFVNYSSGSDADWLWIADRFFIRGVDRGLEPLPFYAAVISDPTVSRVMWAGLGHAFRTTTHGQGSLSLADFRARCNLWTGSFADLCGDWAELGDPTVRGMLIHGDVPGCFGITLDPPPAPQVCPAPYPYGTDRDGGNISMIERARGHAGTIWAGTSLGRVFISRNANAADPATVTFDRVDSDSDIDPARFVSGIAIDPANENRAWITYSSYDAATPSTPGHVFEVLYNPIAGTATWTRIDGGTGGLPDTPATDVAYDDVTGDLYVSNDFGVAMRAAGSATWVQAAEGMPNVMVPSLTMLSGERILYAASHGFGAWRLNLG
jgi:photosystem II stability/assembly factor-like uncharacterized protein